MKRCDCVALCNKALADKNAELDTRLMMNFKTGDAYLAMTLPLRKLDSSKKAKLPSMFPTYCPICGTKLIAEKKSKV